MTLVVGCGGSSTPQVTCDGGACGDARRDTSAAKLDVAPPKLDTAALDTVAPNLDTAPTPIPDAGTADVPPANPDVPPINPDVPPANPDVPANLDVAGDTIDAPASNPDVLKFDVPPANPDVPAADVLLAPDAPRDTTTAGDAGFDAPTANADASHDGIAILADAPRDSADGSADGVDGLLVTDASDGGADTHADGAADTAGPDGPADVAGAEAFNGDVGGCSSGDACHAYSFQSDNLDGGLPSGFAAVAGGVANVWKMEEDGTNKILVGTGVNTPTYVEVADVGGTDQTIDVKVRLSGAPTGAASTDGDHTVRICGRFAATTQQGYCLYVTTVASDAGSTRGAVAIYKRSDTVNSVGPWVGNLDIMDGTWHTYRLSMSGAGPVELNAYLDNAAVPVISRTDTSNTPPYLTAGGAAIGVRNITADIDDVLVTTP
jgi:hypothetical protein